MNLLPKQIELIVDVPNGYGSRSVNAGRLADGSPSTKPIQWGNVALHNEDRINPFGDGTLFGTDRIGGQTLRLSLVVKVHQLNELISAWRSRTPRNGTGDTAKLRIGKPDGSGVVRVYGRPRHITPIESKGWRNVDYVAVEADFQAEDHLFYEDQQQGISLTSAGPSTAYAGVQWPVVWPVLWGPTGGAIPLYETIQISGTEPVRPRIYFWGPTSGVASNPVVRFQGLGLRVHLQTVLHPGDVYVVDARLNTRGVTTSGNARADGILRGIFLDELWLYPGGQVVDYIVDDNSGTSHVSINWRSATAAL